MFGFGKKVIINVIFTGKEIQLLKDITESMYNSIVPLKNIPGNVIIAIEEATSAAHSLNGNQIHSISDEESIFKKFEKLIYVVSEYVSNNKNSNIIFLSKRLIYLAETFDDIIKRVLQEEVPFILLLEITHRKTQSFISRAKIPTRKIA